MKPYFPEILFLVAQISIRSVPAADILCDKTSALHESKEITRFCATIIVDEGYQPVICDTEGEKASSEQCPANTYQSAKRCSSDFHLCERHSTCPLPNMITLNNGSRTSNTICQCNEGAGYINSVSGNTAPTEFYHCIKTEEMVSQPSSVQSVTSGYPAGTESNVWIYIVAFVTLFSLCAVCGTLVYFLRKKICRNAHSKCICNEIMNENNEPSAQVPSTVGGPSSIAVSDQNISLLNERSNATDTDAHLSVLLNQSTPNEAESDIGSDSREIVSLHPDDDSSNSDNFASLCCRSGKSPLHSPTKEFHSVNGNDRCIDR